VLSQPFVLNQITGMMDRGHDVDIYASYRREAEKCHQQIESYGLLERTRFFSDMPKKYPLRLAKAIVLVLRRGVWRQPGLILRSLIPSKHRRSGINLRLLYRALALADRHGYDIIHCQFGTLVPLVLELKQVGATHGKLVTSFRGFDITKVLVEKPTFYDELFQHGAMFLPVSRSLRERLEKAGCPPSRIKVLHSGIDCRLFRFSERYKGKEDGIRLLSIGRFVEKKGLEYAIEAVANLTKTGREVNYTIIGDGERRAKLEKMVRDLKISSSVTFLGWCEHGEIIRLLEDSHLLIAPSVTAEDGDQEGIPNVLKEAMATGLPVLSTFHSGIPELVENGVTGYLVPERDTQALTERLIYLYDHPEHWAEMGKKARDKIDAEFDMAKINDSLEQVYQRVAGAEPGCIR